MKIKKLVFFAFLAISLFAGCDKKEKISEENISTKQENNVHKIKHFQLNVANGSAITIEADYQKGWKLKGLEGKAILLDFFGTWCPPCKAEIPHLIDLREKYKDNFEVIGIDIGSRSGQPTTKEDIDAFIAKFNITYPLAIAGDNGKLYYELNHMNPQGSIPFMVMLDKNGVYVTHYIGMVPEEMIESDLKKTLGK